MRVSLLNTDQISSALPVTPYKNNTLRILRNIYYSSFSTLHLHKNKRYNILKTPKINTTQEKIFLLQDRFPDEVYPCSLPHNGTKFILSEQVHIPIPPPPASFSGLVEFFFLLLLPLRCLVDFRTWEILFPCCWSSFQPCSWNGS